MSEPRVTAEEMVEALINRIAGLEMELASAQIIIRKLQGGSNGQANGQKKELTEDELVRLAEQAVSDK